MKAYGLPRYKQLDYIGDIFNQKEYATKSIHYKCPKHIECIHNCLKCVKNKDLHSTIRSTKRKKQIRQEQKGKARAATKRLLLKELS